MIDIVNIIYQTTREVINLEDKLQIATLFIFCYELDSKKFAELLYTNDHKSFFKKLNTDYSAYKIDFTVNFDNVNVNNSFFKTLKEVKEKYDKDGYYKALFENDAFALVIYDITKNKNLFTHENIHHHLDHLYKHSGA